MKILYVINHIDWFWSHRLSLAMAAKDAGYEVHVAVPGASEDVRFSEYGFVAHELPGGGLRSIVGALRALFSQVKPEIVHAITIKTAFVVGLAGIGVRGVRFVHTLAGLGYLFSDGVKPWVLRLALWVPMRFAFRGARLIFQNPDDLAIMVRRGFVRAAQCFLIRGSGVDVERFVFSEEVESDVPLVIMPTRLVYDKGVAVFIEAAKVLKERGVVARFQIAGGVTRNNPNAISEGEMKVMLAESDVDWLGKVADMPSLFAACHLVVYPSYYGEGVPKVLLEAAAMGRAIVTTDHTGCREAVQDGENGILVPVKDAVAVADAVGVLLGDDERRKAMGVRSREIAVAEFGVERVNAETLAVYRAV